MYIVFLIPTAILISTLLIYQLIKRGLEFFLNDLNEKATEIGRIKNLNFMKELLTFFFNSNASETAQMVVDRSGSSGMMSESAFDDAAIFVGKDVENLYQEMNKSNEPRVEFEKIKFESGILRYILVTYGVLIALLEYVLIIYSILAGRTSLFNLFDGILLGGTVIISSVIVIIAIDLNRLSGRLNSMMESLTYSYSADSKNSATQ